MSTPPPRRGRGLHGLVVGALGGRIVNGELAEGEIVDLEALAKEHEVSRTVVREAVRFLTAKGLLGARPKLGTYVQPRSAWLMLDPDVLALFEAAEPDATLLADLEEFRQVVEPAAAALAARRRSASQLSTIRRHFEALTEAGDVEVIVAADLAFHRAILDATRNELLRSLHVLLEPSLAMRDRLVTLRHVHDDRYLHQHGTVADAIGARDPEAARAAMAVLLRHAATDTRRVAGTPRRRR